MPPQPLVCPCGAHIALVDTRIHRRTCQQWQHWSKRQQEMYLVYAEMPIHKGQHKWNITAAVTMGVAYTKVHGVVPNVSHCKAMYCMPDYKDVERLFGTIIVFHTAIQEGLHANVA